MALRNVGSYTFSPSQLGIARDSSRVTVNEVMRDPKLVAAMAGPMYGATGSGSCGGGLNPCTRQLDTRRGVNLAGSRPMSGMTISVKGGVAHVKPQNAVASGADVAIQLFPTLVWNGANVASREPESSVAGLGILGDGRLLYLVASGGTLKDLGDLFIQYGARYAGYTDAGASAALYVRGEGFRGVHARNPRLPAWIVVQSNGRKAGIGTALLTTFGLLLSTVAIAGVVSWARNR